MTHSLNVTELVIFIGGLAPVLLDAAVKGAALLTLAWAGTTLWRRGSAALRHALWLAAVLGLLVLPVLGAALPAWRVLPKWMEWRTAEPVASVVPAPVTVRRESPSAAGVATVGMEDGAKPQAAMANPALDAMAGGALAADRTTRAVPESPTEANSPGHEGGRMAMPGPDPRHTEPVPVVQSPAVSGRADAIAGAVVLIWLAGVLLLTGRLVLSALLLGRIGRAASALEDEPWAQDLEKLRREMGIRGPVALRQSNQRIMPMTWGLLRARILLPEEATAWPAQRRRLVLVHELAHVKRRDCLTQTAAQLACALHWFNPLAWHACRQMAAQRERACDDRVLATGSAAGAYAQEILRIAGSLRTPLLAAAGGIAMARASSLEGRMLAILDGRRNRRRLTSVSVAALLAAVAIMLVPLAMMRAVQAEETVATPKMQSATQPAPATQPAVRSLEELWQAMSGETYNEALAAARQMAAQGDGAVAFLGERLQPARGTPAEIARLIADLDSENYEVREAATRDLAALGGIAWDAVQHAAIEAASVDTRQRAAVLLAAMDDPTDKANVMATWGTAVLEAIDSPKSAALLDRLAQGPKDAWLTRRAAAAQQRLAAAGRLLDKPEPAILEMRMMPTAEVATMMLRPETTVQQALAGLASQGPSAEKGPGRLFRWFECDTPLPAEAIVGAYQGKTYVLLWEDSAHLPGNHSPSDPWEMARILAVQDNQGVPAVEFELGKYAAGYVSRSGVGSNSGRFVALMVGDRIVAITLLRPERLPSQGTLDALMSAREAQAIVKRLRAGMTPLCELAEAIEAGTIDIVRRILDDHPGIERARSESRGLYGRTPLHVAISFKKWEIAQLLLDRGADVNAVEAKSEQTALHWANDAETVGFLIKRGADLKAVDKSGLTPLHRVVCESVHPEAVAALLEAGADVNSVGKVGITPLAMVLVTKAFETRAKDRALVDAAVKLLLDRGARLDVLSAAGLGRVDELATMIARKEPLEVDVPTMKGRIGALNVAAMCGQAKAAKLLIEAGADINANLLRTGTPLHGAARNGHGEIVKLLLASGADPNAGTERKELPIHLAAQQGHAAVVAQLLDAGSGVNPAASDGRTPLHAAAAQGRLDAVKLLLARGADARGKTATETPLHILCKMVLGASDAGLEEGQDYAGCTKALLAAGADVNAPDTDGRMPLHCVCGHRWSGSPSPTQVLQVTRALLAGGADVNAVVRDKPNSGSGYRGMLPILFAVETCDDELIKTLLEAGADPFVETGMMGSNRMPVESLAGATSLEGKRAYELLKAATDKREQAAQKQVEAVAAAFFKAVNNGDDNAALNLTVAGLDVWQHEKWPVRINRLRTTFAGHSELLQTIVAAKARPNWAEIRMAVPPQPPKPGQPGQPGQPVKDRCIVFILMRMPDNSWRLGDFCEMFHSPQERLGIYLQNNVDVFGGGFREKVFKDAKPTPGTAATRPAQPATPGIPATQPAGSATGKKLKIA